MGTNGGGVVAQLLAVNLCLSLFYCNSALGGQDDEFEKWASVEQAEFTDYLAKEEKEWADYKKEIELKWQEFVGSTQKDWVEYTSDKNARSIVNFKEGLVTIEVITPVDEDGLPLTKQQEGGRKLTLENIVNKRIAKKLSDLLADKKNMGESPVKDQIMSDNGITITKKNVSDFSKKEVKKRVKVNRGAYTAKDGGKRIKSSVTIKLVPNHLKVRANRFKQFVETYSEKYGVDRALVYAVIHTESYFNPKARSHVPAYGLMQLVPRSGGRDAYNYVKGRDQAPSPSFLYSAKNNINLGVAYLDLLSKREFKRVNDRTIRNYLVIAAYNTGASNVSRAFAGKRSLRKSVEMVNRMSHKEVYNALVAKLPYEETRNYIQKVVERQAIYETF
jgi:membrane-bound lytic murein transglycosylase C